MLNSKILAVFLVAVVATVSSSYVVKSRYEETLTYLFNKQCKPSTLNKGIQCSAIGPQVNVTGGLYGDFEFHYIPLASAYYVARMADAMGYQDCCPTNRTFLRQLDIVTPWGGPHSPPVGTGIAIDGACGLDRNILRRCTFPDPPRYPFICYGSEGNPGTYGKRLEAVSYYSVLQGSNEKWTLFIQCWGDKTPKNPNAVAKYTSFMVFNLEKTLPDGDRGLIIDKLNALGFDTSAENLIEFDYRTTECSCNKRR